MSDWNPNPGVRPASEISVAVMYTGGRAEKMIVPLKATDLDLAIEPSNPWTYDLVLLDNADREMVWPVCRKHLPDTDAKVVYRMRGNVYEEIDRWDMLPIKEWLAKAILRHADGFIAVSSGMATIARRRAGVEPVGVAGLAKRTDEWPTVDHTEPTVRAITLTNADYFEKVEPTVRWADVFEAWADTHGGVWHVYGAGMHTEWLDAALAQYDHVAFRGYTETPNETIADYNTMIHLSELDALPNSVLEGFASGLPVITNDFYSFTDTAAPLSVVHGASDFRAQLGQLSAPDERRARGERNLEYIREHHTPAAVGEQYVRYFQRLLNDEQ
jgi:glycosyltransferase involved in cell wall biosynthesis